MMFLLIDSKGFLKWVPASSYKPPSHYCLAIPAHPLEDDLAPTFKDIIFELYETHLDEGYCVYHQARRS